MRKKLVYALFLTFTIIHFFPSVLASSQCFSDIAIENKLYVNQQDITINENGIFLFLNDEMLRIKEIHSDEKGIFIPKMYVWCKKGHKTVCWMCEGCDVWWCTFRCRCVNP